MILSVRVSVCIFTLLSLMACVSHSGPQSKVPVPAILPSASPLAKPDAAATNDSDDQPHTTAEASAQPAVPSPSASPAGTGGSDPASTLLPVNPLLDPVIRGGGGGSGSTGGSTGTPQPSPTPLFYIADVTLADTDQSVMGANAPAAIAPVYTADAPIELLITGNFATQMPLTLDAARFTFEPGLLHQSFQGEQPLVRAVLNETFLLGFEEVSPQQLRLTFSPYLIPDFQLGGMHTLRLYVGEQMVSASLRFETAPLPVPPEIHAVSVIQEANEPAYLQLTGGHFSLNPAWSELRLNGEVLPLGPVHIFANGQSEVWADVRQLTGFDPQAGHELVYQNPAGSVVFVF